MQKNEECTCKACKTVVFRRQICKFLTFSSPSSSWLLKLPIVSWGPLLESPEIFGAHFGWHNSLWIFKTKTSRGRKHCSYFNFYSLYNTAWKDQFYKMDGSEFYKWLFGLKNFSGLSRNGPLASSMSLLKLTKTVLSCRGTKYAVNKCARAKSAKLLF